MVFGRFRGQARQPPSPSKSLESEPLVMVEKAKLHEEEDGWAEVLDEKPQSAGTGATTDEDETGVVVEEPWDWAIEGEHQPEDGEIDGFEALSPQRWVLDEHLLDGEEPLEAKLEPHGQEDEKTSCKEETLCTQEAETSPASQPNDHDKEPEDESGYRCRSCGMDIFREADILSSNYQAMTGPGYLIAATRNTSAAAETQAVVYTTGTYMVREVSCEFCDNKLGVTYAVAPDARNAYKVGKFLIGADRLILPPGVTHPKIGR
eukprot:TRINITY_DN33375_c0_g1_i1.p1 TRINITY_DN33375_c0_g1~~TRINITY_DN33375_c0_g1_i1.p1  ORF type:complete len:262 (-),score=63.49 TRINITY_DN33375_c0_g1_i1:60-845(-)